MDDTVEVEIEEDQEEDFQVDEVLDTKVEVLEGDLLEDDTEVDELVALNLTRAHEVEENQEEEILMVGRNKKLHFF